VARAAAPAAPLLPAAPRAARQLDEVTQVVRRSSGTLEQISESGKAVLPEITAITQVTAPVVQVPVAQVSPTVMRGTDFFLSRSAELTRTYQALNRAFQAAPQATTVQRFLDRVANGPNGQLAVCGLVAAHDLLRGFGEEAILFDTAFTSAAVTVLSARNITCDRRGR
jgi:hypothetical protein